MPRVPLIQGAYEARGVIANAQRCVNLVPEPLPQDAPFPTFHFPASGLAIFADYTGTYSGYVRGFYWSSAYNQTYAVIGSSLIMLLGWYDTTGLFVGDVGNSGNPISMVDNGTTMMVVDGTAVAPGASGPPPTGGWTFALANPAGTFAAITDPGFYGANRVDFIDTFFVLNWPGTPTFYQSLSNSATFTDPSLGTFFAEKTGYSDNLISIAALHDNIWLLGAVTSEVWFDAGTAGLSFMRMPNSVIQQGCIAPYSVVVSDNGLYWLSQDRWGRAILMRGEGYMARRVSNFAIENEWANYVIVSDCIAMGYQMAGHPIVLLYFPTANASWAYDASTNMWHRRSYGDDVTAWLPYCTGYWGATVVGTGSPNFGIENVVLVGDRTAPRILYMDRHEYTDVGVPIQRIRSWPHILNDQKRASHAQFAAALQPLLDPDPPAPPPAPTEGTAWDASPWDTGAWDAAGTSPPAPAPPPNGSAYSVNLRWSDDGGQTFGNYVPQTVLNGWPQTYGQYSWRRLGLCRDRVYELSWTSPVETCLNGAWVEIVPSQT